MKEKPLMPVLFIGHGSPMNAIEDNRFTKDWERVVKLIPRPDTILSISAHWYIPNTKVLAVEHPRTIHDFYGFPEVLYQQQYPAAGNVPLAKRISSSTGALLDTDWGLDHGTWSVLKRMYPDADIPTLQLSISYTQPPRYHYEIMSMLKELRA
ncbi:MAG: dioxygenase, partial [Candidatus Thorarchaeota archaeon]